MNNNDNQYGMTLSDIFSDRYVVPLYQRNFAWRTDEIQQLLQDIWDAFQKSNTGNYYIGSLVVMKRHNGDYEVIDGQQRLTVISLIAILMGKLTRPMLFYDSAAHVRSWRRWAPAASAPCGRRAGCWRSGWSWPPVPGLAGRRSWRYGSAEVVILQRELCEARAPASRPALLQS